MSSDNKKTSKNTGCNKIMEEEGNEKHKHNDKEEEETEIGNVEIEENKMTENRETGKLGKQRGEKRRLRNFPVKFLIIVLM